VVSLLESSHDLVGEVLDDAILTVQRRIEHDLPETLASEGLDLLHPLGARAANTGGLDGSRRHEARFLGIDEAVVAPVQALVSDLRRRLRQPVEIGLPDRPSVFRRILAGLEVLSDEIVEA